MKIETLGSLALDAGRPIEPPDIEKRGDSLENPKTSLDRAFAMLGEGAMTHAGESVNATSAMTISAVFRAVDIISGLVARLPLVIYRSTGNNQRERARDHALHTLLTKRANPGMSAFRFKRIMQAWVLLQGNAYALLDVSRNGRITALWPIHPSRVFIVAGGYAVMMPDGERRLFRDGMMLHLRGPEVDESGYGLSVIGQGRQSLGLTLAAERFGASFFANGATMGGLLEMPQSMSPEAKAALTAYIRKHNTGSGNAHKVVPVDSGTTFHQTSINPEDAQLLLTRSFQVEDVARWFGIPLHLLMHTEKSTSYGTGLEQNNIGLLQFTIGTHLETWTSECELALLSESEARTYYLEFITEALLITDIKNRYASYRTGIQGGFLTPNEARRADNRPPLPGGDKLFIQGATVPITDAGKEMNVQPGAKKLPGGTSSGEDGE